MKQVAYVGKVIEINHIESADFIVSITVICGEGGRWKGTAQKGIFKVDDLCEVYLQDAIVPKEERFSFMEKHNYRIKMRKFKGVPSEVLIVPCISPGQVGDYIPNIEKYEKPIPANMMGLILGDFPSFIPKTDELNFQTAPEMVEMLKGKPCYITIKCDGCSATFYKYNEHFGVCSRNLELKETETTLWDLAKKYKLPEKLPEGYAIQAEVCGEGIQSNPLGLKGQDLFVFNVFDIINHKYLGAWEFIEFVDRLKLPRVTIVSFDTIIDLSEDNLRKMAEGVYDNKKQREGIVIRPMIEMETKKGERVSFKVINLMYKD